MRQAGRYLPSYQKIKSKYSLEEMFRTPSLIYEITMQPIDILDVDAAILFADILHIPLSLSLDVSFPGKGGPVVAPLITSSSDIKYLQKIPMQESLFFVEEGIKLLKRDLLKPLIGFCGGPFTVMSYMCGKKIKQWLYNDPVGCRAILDMITEQSIDYLNMQIDAGVNALQIFDSWANILSHEEFKNFALPYLKKIIDTVKRVPVIIFSRASCQFVEDIVSLNPAGISFDWTYSVEKIREKVPGHIAIQGNLDPQILYAHPKIIKQETLKMMHKMRKDPAYIVNLGHGVLPDIPVDHVKAFVETVKNYLP